MSKRKSSKTIIKPQKDTSSYPVLLIGILCGIIAITLTWAGVSLVRSALSPSSDPILIAGDATPEWEGNLQQEIHGNSSVSVFDLLRDASSNEYSVREHETQNEEFNESEEESPKSAYPPESWTARYAEEMNIELTRIAIRESLRHQPELVKRFIERHATDTILPDIPEETLIITEEGGRDAVARYLKQISVNHNNNLHPVEKTAIVSAFSKATQPLPSSTDLEAILLTLSSNIHTLEAVPVPREAVQLHRTYLSATMALFSYTEDLLTYNKDPVGALMAAVRIDRLQDVYNEAADLIAEFENRYTIK